jgi:hypothetical protein
MRDFAQLLALLGSVRAFNFTYMLAGKKRPDPLPKLIETYRAALADFAVKIGAVIPLAGLVMNPNWRLSKATSK